MSRATVGLLLAPFVAKAFELNVQNTTPWGPAWADAILSEVADFVPCRGPYALCFYALCQERQQTGDWVQGTFRTVDCPCSNHDGIYMVMINGILDKGLWQATRDKCPMGSVSCPMPNSAPVCDSINSGTFLGGSSRISAFGFDTLKPSLWPLSVTQCDKGPFAACMTAPCKSAADGKSSICECPIFDKSEFQVQKSNACAPSDGSVPSGFNFQPTPPADAAMQVMFPEPTCQAVPQLCYESYGEQLQQLSLEDQVSCVGKHAVQLRQGRCADFGFDFSLGFDPVFSTVRIASKIPALPPPSEVLERCEKRGKVYNLRGKRALIVATSHDKLGAESCTTCKSTGAASPEMTVPFLIFRDAGVDVTIATIEGGDVPIDSVAKFYTHWDTAFWGDASAVAATKGTQPVSAVNFTDFDLVYMVGGWGAAYDLGYSEALGRGVTAAFAAGKVLGSVCHGALGFINALKPDGSLLVKGTVMTGVTNRQVQQLGIGKITPMHPEEELVKRGALYKASRGILTDIDQSLVVEDGNIVTGQNQNSACETAQKMLDKLAVDDEMLVV